MNIENVLYKFIIIIINHTVTISPSFYFNLAMVNKSSCDSKKIGLFDI